MAQTSAGQFLSVKEGQSGALRVAGNYGCPTCCSWRAPVEAFATAFLSLPSTWDHWHTLRPGGRTISPAGEWLCTVLRALDRGVKSWCHATLTVNDETVLALADTKILMHHHQEPCCRVLTCATRHHCNRCVVRGVVSQSEAPQLAPLAHRLHQPLDSSPCTATPTVPSASRLLEAASLWTLLR